MNLGRRILDEIQTAMKSGDKLRLETLRLMRARLHEKEISKRPIAEMTDEDEMSVLRSLVTRHDESIEHFEKGGRIDLAEKERRQRGIVQSFLPQQMSRLDIGGALKTIIRDLEARSARDVDKVMSVAMKSLSGRADGKLVREIATSILQSPS